MEQRRRPQLVLVASITAFTLVVIGTTVVNVALPAIRHDLGGDVAGLQWVINAYTLMLASLLLTMGALCDQRGARRIMLGGVALFAAGATVASAAPTLGLLIAGQFLLGTAAAALLPASLALLSSAHPDDAGRARAIAVFASASAVTIGIGPVLGGLLIQTLGWRAVFAMDIPLALLVGLLVAGWVPETPRRPAAGLDLPGQVTAITSLAAFTFAIIHSGSAGWGSPVTLGPLALALATGALFIGLEQRGHSPMLPLELFESRTFSVAVLAGLLVNFGVYGLFFVLSLYLQQVRGLSALHTGLAFLVQPFTAALVTLPAGRITARRGPRIPVAVGGLVGALAALVLLTVDADSSLAIVVLALAGLGVGGGLSIPPLTTAVVATAPRTQVGVAAATFTTGRQTGGILGVAILGAMVSAGPFLAGLHLATIFCAAALATSGLAGGLLIASGHRGSAAHSEAVAVTEA